MVIDKCMKGGKGPQLMPDGKVGSTYEAFHFIFVLAVLPVLWVGRVN